MLQWLYCMGVLNLYQAVRSNKKVIRLFRYYSYFRDKTYVNAMKTVHPRYKLAPLVGLTTSCSRLSLAFIVSTS